MKKLFILIGVISVMMSCDEDGKFTDIGDLEFDSYVIENYMNDAKQLYYHEIIQNHSHANFNNPVMNENEVDKILGIIQAVYNADVPERDTVFDIYKIHGYYCYSLSSISLKVKTELPEIQNLANGIFPTGNASLDDLLNAYRFDSVSVSYDYPSFPWLTIYTKGEYNMIPVEKAFGDIKSVQIAEFNKGCIGDGNHITLIRKSDYAIITFSIGYGDCPAGCIYHRYWEFKVSDGGARFIKAY